LSARLPRFLPAGVRSVVDGAGRGGGPGRRHADHRGADGHQEPQQRHLRPREAARGPSRSFASRPLRDGNNPPFTNFAAL